MISFLFFLTTTYNTVQKRFILSYKISGFRTSAFNSDFGQEFATTPASKVTMNYQQFPKGPALSSEMTDLYCASKTDEMFSQFVKNMLVLQNHTKAYMDAVNKNDYRAMASALTAVPEISEIKAHFFTGKTSKQVMVFYTSRMIINKGVKK